MNINNNLMSDNTDIIIPALRKAKKAFAPIIKNKEGYGYKYADFADCIEAIEEALDANGLCFTQSVETDATGKAVVTVLLHDSGQWIKSKFLLEAVVMKKCNVMQQLGAGVTYAKCYGLCGILGIATEDDDAASLSHNEQKEEIKAVAANAKALANDLMNMCKESGIDTKEFAQFSGVSSANPDSISNSIEHFESLRDNYLEVQSETA